MPIVNFVRVLRCKKMKFGIAIDTCGRKWRGFFANTTVEQIRQTADLGGVGLCWNCRSRVYEGWECLTVKDRDLCIRCFQLPEADKIFMVEAMNPEDFVKLQQRFFKQKDFKLPQNGVNND
jgi:hypothetical protein